MGIPNLLPNLKSICRKSHIGVYEGRRVAVDAYVWLHRGSYSCSMEICTGVETTKYVNYCLNLMRMLRYNKVIPVLVFDGARLPSKGQKEKERRRNRKENLQRAHDLINAGQMSLAQDYFKKAVDITPRMAYNVIKAARRENVECIVAPYEADAQLAWLSRSGYVDCVITEDSDLIPYGATRIFFKMDSYGNGVEYVSSNMGLNTTLNFAGFTQDMVIYMCILSGCDYLDSLPNIGVKTAHRIVRENRRVEEMFHALRKIRKGKLPEEYMTGFMRALLTFKHQRAFDVVNKELVCLTPLPADHDVNDYDFLGPLIDAENVRLICDGQIDPMTYEPFETSKVESRSSKNGGGVHDSMEKSPARGSILSYFGSKMPASVRQPFRAPKMISTSHQPLDASSSSLSSSGKPVNGSSRRRVSNTLSMSAPCETATSANLSTLSNDSGDVNMENNCSSEGVGEGESEDEEDEQESEANVNDEKENLGETDNNDNKARKEWERNAVAYVRSVMPSIMMRQPQRKSLLVKSKFFAQRQGPAETSTSSQTRREDLLVETTQSTAETNTKRGPLLTQRKRQLVSVLSQSSDVSVRSISSSSSQCDVTKEMDHNDDDDDDDGDEKAIGSLEAHSDNRSSSSENGDNSSNDSNSNKMDMESDASSQKLSPTCTKRSFSSAFSANLSQVSNISRDNPNRLVRPRRRVLLGLSQERHRISTQSSLGSQHCVTPSSPSPSHSQSLSEASPEASQSSQALQPSPESSPDTVRTTTQSNEAIQSNSVVKGKDCHSRVIEHQNVMTIDIEDEEESEDSLVGGDTSLMDKKKHRWSTITSEVIDLTDSQNDEESFGSSSKPSVMPEKRMTGQLKLTIFEKFNHLMKKRKNK